MTDGNILNDAEVDFLLKGAEEKAPVKERLSLDEIDLTVTMRGDLEKIHLSDIFQTLAMSGMEGVLRVRNSLDEREVYCADGYVRILVPNRVALRRLGSRLVQAGLLTGDQLRSALIAQNQEHVPLGELLVRDGLVTTEQVDDIVGLQVAEDLFALFTWKHGSFEFFKADAENEDLAAHFEHCPEYEINSLLLEVARRSDEWESILDELLSLDEIPHQVAEPEDLEQLDASHRAVLEHVDGRASYRDLSDQTTISLFDFCRAARDLSAGGILRPIDDPALVEVAAGLAEEGEQQRAVLLLQTLRDRPGDRPLEVIRRMAEILGAADEPRIASQLLIEVAQRSPDPEEALQLARDARAMVPYDCGTLSFLRTVLVAHAEPDSAELEKCTLDLLDALIENDLIPTAIDIIDDARRTGTIRPQILVREIRARQRAKDVDGAVRCLEELTEHYKQIGNRQKQLESLEAIARLDRTRKDVLRTIAAMKRSRAERLVRIGVVTVLGLALLGSGVVWLQQRAFEASLVAADVEIQQLLDSGDVAGARASFERWARSLGECEATDDLRSRVAFAEAAAAKRRADLARADVYAKLRVAAEACEQGRIADALRAYTELQDRADARDEARNVANLRLDELAGKLEAAAGELGAELPPTPDELLDRGELSDNLRRLHEAFPGPAQKAFAELTQLRSRAELPEFVGPEQRARIDALFATHGEHLQTAAELTRQYGAAIERNDTQRRLDPLFQAAVAKEKAFDFAGALDLYRQLEQATTDDPELRTHFSDRVSRNATITRLMGEIATATEGRDYEVALQHLKALRMQFQDVEFDHAVRLPLTIESEPSGARVLVDGEELGRTPLSLSRRPTDELAVTVDAEGFAATSTRIRGDYGPRWTARLTLRPNAEWQHDRAVEAPPARSADGDWLFVDRGGDVLRRDAALETTAWRFATKDLSGWLTPPIVDGDAVVVASLDGPLRALRARNGAALWQLDDMPCEVRPARVQRTLVVATSDSRLHSIDLAARRRLVVDLREPACGALLRHRDAVLVVGEEGALVCVSVPDLEVLWRARLAGVIRPTATVVGDVLVAGDDQGRVFGVDALQGRILWQRDLETTLVGHLAATADRIYLPTQNALLCLDTRTGADLSAVPAPETGWDGAVTVVGERLVVPLAAGALQVVDAASGEMLYRLAGDADSKVLEADDGSVFVSHRDHRVCAYGALR